MQIYTYNCQHSICIYFIKELQSVEEKDHRNIRTVIRILKCNHVVTERNLRLQMFW